MNDRQSNRNGFTLLEVLVALVIFTVGVSGIMVTLTHHMRDVSFSEDHARALRIANREMNRIRRLRIAPDPESSGVDGRYVWNATVDTSEDDLPGITESDTGKTQALQPYQISLTVQWSDVPEGELKRELSLQGLELFRAR